MGDDKPASEVVRAALTDKLREAAGRPPARKLKATPGGSYRKPKGEPKTLAPRKERKPPRAKRDQLTGLLKEFTDAEKEAAAKAVIATGFRLKPALQQVWPDVPAATSMHWLRGLLYYGELDELLSAHMTALHDRLDDELATVPGVIKTLTSHACANVMDYFRQDEDGNLHVRGDLSELPVEVQQRIRKMKVTSRKVTGPDDEDVVIEQRVELELVDPQRAVESLARHLGMYEGIMEKEIADLAKELSARLKRAREAQERMDDARTLEGDYARS